MAHHKKPASCPALLAVGIACWFFSLPMLGYLLMKMLLIDSIIVVFNASFLGSFFCGGFDQNLL
ncbi:MAG: hypothetical protein DCE90_08915 [Pseudanabaena sp.]|nr:MAG: hypothetical protein DCE90_08915 [Pseudanabaena sp.]